MRIDAPVHDEDVRDHEQHRRDPVERGVHGGQCVNAHRLSAIITIQTSGRYTSEPKNSRRADTSDRVLANCVASHSMAMPSTAAMPTYAMPLNPTSVGIRLTG